MSSSPIRLQGFSTFPETVTKDAAEIRVDDVIDGGGRVFEISPSVGGFVVHTPIGSAWFDRFEQVTVLA